MVPSKWCVALLVCLLPMANPSRAGERILVPPPDRDEPMTIQQAIDIARDGDTELVADGVYYENIRLNGKKIVVASYDLFREGDKHATRTIIRGNDRALVPQPAVFFTGGENSETLLLGFTVEGGTGTAFEYGGAGFVVSNNSGAGILEIARSNGITALHLSQKQFPSEESFVTALLDAFREHDVNFIALAGYMKQVHPYVISRFRGRILNIHPALLPKYGGKGMYGHFVHEAVIASRDTVSGATVHVVDEEYDHGAIVLQRTVPIAPDDTPGTLAAEVLAVEHQIYPEAIRMVAEGKFPT